LKINRAGIFIFQIKTYNQIISIGLDNFKHDNYEVANSLAEPEALVLRSCKLRLPIQSKQ